MSTANAEELGPIRTLTVVGGTRGLGLAVAQAGISTYKRVIITGRKQPTTTLSPQIEYMPSDCCDIGEAERILSLVKPDTLVLSAAKGLYIDPAQLRSETDVIEAIAITFAASVIWLSAAIRLMAPGTKIAWISSLTAKVPSAQWAVYAACKAGVSHYIDCVRDSFNARSISVTVCYPGCLKTGFHGAAGAPYPHESIPPQSIANDLLMATEHRMESWAAPMDSQVVADLDQISQQMGRYYQGHLK